MPYAGKCLVSLRLEFDITALYPVCVCVCVRDKCGKVNGPSSDYFLIDRVLEKKK